MSVRLLEDGRDSAEAEYGREQRAYGGVTWWRPVSNYRLREVAGDLFQAGRTTDAVTALRWVTDAYPHSSDAWEDRAEGCLTAGDTARAVAYDHRSLRLDPTNQYARNGLDALPATYRDTTVVGRC